MPQITGHIRNYFADLFGGLSETEQMVRDYYTQMTDPLRQRLDSLEQAKQDMIPQSLRDAGFGEANPVELPQAPMMTAPDATALMQNSMSQIGMSNPAAAQITGGMPMLAAPSIAEITEYDPEKEKQYKSPGQRETDNIRGVLSEPVQSSGQPSPAGMLYEAQQYNPNIAPFDGRFR